MANKKEIWKPVSIDGRKPAVPYMISNHGRFGVKQNSEIEVRKFKPTAGNYRYNTRIKGKSKAIFLYKEVAKAFLRKPSPKHTYVIHKDHNYLNDNMDNLRWATYEEHRAHTSLSPRSVLARKRKAIVKSAHAKILDEKKVLQLKKLIWDPKRTATFRQLAERFGVSEMQIYRIKNGEFWFHVRAENEPEHSKYRQNLNNISYHEKKNAAGGKKPRRKISPSKTKITRSSAAVEKRAPKKAVKRAGSGRRRKAVKKVSAGRSKRV